MGDVIEFGDLLLLRIGDMIQWINTLKDFRYFNVRFSGSIIDGQKPKRHACSPLKKE